MPDRCAPMAGAQLAEPTIDIGLVTVNRAAMADFYGTVLGFPSLPDLTMKRCVVNRFQVGDCVLKIVEFEREPRGRAVSGPIGASTGLRYWTVSVKNLDELLTAVRDAGETIVEGPTEVLPGVRIALVRDPDGNLVEFVEGTAA